MSRTLVQLVLVVAALSALAAPPPLSAEGFKVIVHPVNPETTLARDLVARFFLKKATQWSSGKGVVPVDLAKDAEARAAFTREVLRKSLGEVSAYWQQQIFSGRAVPPTEKHLEGEVVAFVEATEGAIAYVSAGADVGRAKVVRVTD